MSTLLVSGAVAATLLVLLAVAANRVGAALARASRRDVTEAVLLLAESEELYRDDLHQVTAERWVLRAPESSRLRPLTPELAGRAEELLLGGWLRFEDDVTACGCTHVYLSREAAHVLRDARETAGPRSRAARRERQAAAVPAPRGNDHTQQRTTPAA